MTDVNYRNKFNSLSGKSYLCLRLFYEIETTCDNLWAPSTSLLVNGLKKQVYLVNI